MTSPALRFEVFVIGYRRGPLAIGAFHRSSGGLRQACLWDDSGFLVIAEIGLAWTDTVQSYGQREGWSNSCSGVQPCQSPLRVPTLSYPFDGSTVGSRDRLNDSSRLRIL